MIEERWRRAVDAGERSELWWQVVVALAAGVLPHLYSALASLAFDSDHESESVLDSAGLLTVSASKIVVMMYVARRSGEPKRSFGLVWSWKADLGLTLVVFGAMLLTYVVLGSCLVSLLDPDMDAPRAAFDRPDGALEYALVAAAQFANGLSEEFVIWGVLFTRLMRLWGGAARCVVFASVAFASYHIYQGPYGAGMALGFGVCHGAIFAASGRLWPLALSHALWNMILYSQV